MPTHPRTLESMALFQGLGPRQLETVAAYLYPLRVTEGEVLTRRGEAAATFYVVVEGHFMVYCNEGRAITLHKAGDFMGGSTLAAPFRYSATAVALTHGEVLTMAGEDFQQLLLGNDALGQQILHKIKSVLRERTPNSAQAQEESACNR